MGTVGWYIVICYITPENTIQAELMDYSFCWSTIEIDILARALGAQRKYKNPPNYCAVPVGKLSASLKLNIYMAGFSFM